MASLTNKSKTPQSLKKKRGILWNGMSTRTTHQITNDRQQVLQFAKLIKLKKKKIKSHT